MEGLGSQTEIRRIEQRILRLAGDADIETAGALDRIAPDRRMPPDLRGARRIRVGRHRVYYTGHHTQCSYTMFYVKIYKKSGVDDEDDPRHQRQLAKAIKVATSRELMIEPESGGAP